MTEVNSKGHECLTSWSSMSEDPDHHGHESLLLIGWDITYEHKMQNHMIYVVYGKKLSKFHLHR